MRGRCFGRRLVGLAALALLLLAPTCGEGPADAPVSVRGELRVSAFAAAPAARPADEPTRHRSSFVNGARWRGMEDNDLRGFLDGRFRYGWNQPGQFHVRAGRLKGGVRWGEYELFRTLHKWERVALPPGAQVEAARMRIAVEESAPLSRRVTLLLYEVKPDFDPGQGGTRGDNLSPPKKGEVWWGEIGHEERAWGLPGAGFASDVDPESDTGAQALAEVVVDRDTRWTVLESPALAEYVQRRLSEGRALQFLLKLSDEDEDSRGTSIKMFSGNIGLDRNPARRPRLELDWVSDHEIASARQRVHLEHGRVADVPLPDAPGAVAWAATFLPMEGSEHPGMEAAVGGSQWSRIGPGGVEGAGPLALRLVSARDPIDRNTPFRASFRDTWVTSAPAESQVVRFTFVDPNGEAHEVAGEYDGDSRWRVEFTPDQLGRWRYWFEHDLDEPGWRSADGVFDVLPGDRAAIARQLASLAAAAHEPARQDANAAIGIYGSEFWRLERAATQAFAGEGWSSDAASAMDAEIAAVRRSLDPRKELPDRIGMRPAKIVFPGEDEKK